MRPDQDQLLLENLLTISLLYMPRDICVNSYSSYIICGDWHVYSVKDRVYLQPGLEESSFNPLRDKQIDHPYVYFNESYD